MIPTQGDTYPDRYSPGCEWRVDAIGAHTKLVYLRMWRDGKPTQSTMQWPGDRWNHLVETQLSADNKENP